MLTGTITNWNQQSAWGFIERDDGGPDVFLHINGFAEKVVALNFNPRGARIEFEIGENRRKWQAVRNEGEAPRMTPS